MEKKIHYGWIIIFMGLVTTVAAYVPAMALGSAWFSIKKRGFATGIVSGGIGLGTFLSGIIVPFLLTSYGADGWRYSWYILGTIVIVIAIIVFLFLRNQPEDKGLLPVGQEEKKKFQTSSLKDKVSSLDWKKVYRMRGIGNDFFILFSV